METALRQHLLQHVQVHTLLLAGTCFLGTKVVSIPTAAEPLIGFLNAACLHSDFVSLVASIR